MSAYRLKGTIPVYFLKEKQSFIAFSPVIDLSTCGKSFEDAKKNFNEALQIFIEECVEMGTLDRVLESCGWEKIKSKWSPPAYIGEEQMAFSV